MAVSNGQTADQTTFNNAFMSRTKDTSTTGKIDLNNTDSAAIVDLQGTLNQALGDISQAESDIDALEGRAGAIEAELAALGDEQTFTIVNNQTTEADVTGLVFDKNSYKSAIVEYLIQRITTGTGATELVESGSFLVTYLATSDTWRITQLSSDQDAGVTFSITSGGQVQYVSTNITGTASVSKLSYRARKLVG